MATIKDLEAAALKAAAASERSRKRLEDVKAKHGQLSDQFATAYIRYRQKLYYSDHAAEELRKAREEMASKMDQVDMIIAFENGELDGETTIVLFQQLINNGMAWTLQGHYGRVAQGLIDSGFCTRPEEKIAGECVPADADPA